MHRLLSAIVVFAFIASPAVAQTGLITKESRFGVAETIDRLATLAEERGIGVAARVDHAAAARSANLELRPTEVLIFGNPRLGTPLMQSARTIGIDLPLKVLAWEDGAGKVWIAYNDPAFLRERHGISDRDEGFAAMAKALDGLTSAAAGAAR